MNINKDENDPLAGMRGYDTTVGWPVDPADPHDARARGDATGSTPQPGSPESEQSLREFYDRMCRRRVEQAVQRERERIVQRIMALPSMEEDDQHEWILRSDAIAAARDDA